MKKLLSLLAVSTLVGTSTSNLKLLFINNFVNTGFKSNQVNKDISIQSENDTFKNMVIENTIIKKMIITDNDVIWVATEKGLYKSTDGINFNNVFKKNIMALINISNDIYVGTQKNGLWKSTNGINFEQVNGTTNWQIGSISKDSKQNVYFGIADLTIRDFGLYVLKKGENKPIRCLNDTSKPFNSIAIDSQDNMYLGTYPPVGGEVGAFLFRNLNFDNPIALRNIKKPVYSISFDKEENVYFGAENVNCLYFLKNGETKIKEIIGFPQTTIYSINFNSENDMYLGTNNGLYKSTDGINFNLIKLGKKIENEAILSYMVDKNQNIYIGTIIGLLKVDNSLKISKPKYQGKLYNGFVYKNEQKIGIKENLVASATLDNKAITIPTTNLDIFAGEHILVLTLKDEIKQYAELFDGKNGQITYKIWVKTSIDKDKINYKTNIDDTDLLTGLVSDLGNTNNAQIIQTRSKQGSGIHPANLNSNFDDILIDYKNSFYVQGNVDSNNDFTETGSKQKLFKATQITTDGIYHLHLVDVVGNIYDSYLELGESNWKLQGKFDDVALNDKANKLNVTVDSHSASQEVKQEANGWLDNYKNIADSTFTNTVQANGKGFNISIDSDLKGDYKSFLDPVTYVNTQTQYAINQTKLNNEVTKIAEQKLQDGLSVLPQNFNVDTSNVVNQSTLDSYTSWINAYNDFINNHKDQWINDVVSVASRGFATTDQENQIKNHIASLDFKNYLQHVVWTSNSNLSTSNNYQQFVELDKLQSDTIDWVNKNMPEINQSYQNAIKDAESNLNLHGYSISEILNDKKLPKTKSEIDNFADGQSFHDWLQAKADNMYHIWQLKVGLPIGLILLGVTVFASLACYWKFSARHNPIKRAKKTFKPIPDKNIKKKR